ncbi:MAG: helix-turn-helix domain-containing protein [Alicyclobacillus macrosporangiidus]|uniref:helix-turn-helix domain-containing protein n=1 Tax=Alicyclobacillus macrosporangiidus TaxID=392015 RepID=UPI0026EE7E74|nr:helix-turn-helix domain-containing protein [Alicyclobacillus macrosporangiidus]MCL6601100.1 helix-turn-helix domain-containing protein [Alicyclobacillus macrosporangiidus]
MDYSNLPFTLSVHDIAALLGISRTRAYQLVNENDFPKIRVGRRICVPRDAFLRWYGLA